MSFSITMILAIVIVFGILVLVHELGHFITAKLTGMRVDEFAIGFGPKLAGFKYGETLYSIRAIPLGGFNKIAGMEPDDKSAGDRAYWAKPVWQRMIVIVAGAAMNILLAYVLIAAILFTSGIQTPVKEAALGGVIDQKPAAMAGLKKGDIIIAINGEKIATWQQFAAKIKVSDGKVLQVQYLRDGKKAMTNLIPEYDKTAKQAMAGVVAATTHTPVSFASSLVLAAKQVVYITYTMIAAIFGMIMGTVHADLAGPIGVATIIGQAAEIGIQSVLNIMILLSINLGIINLLPIPALDGGHFFTLFIEALRGRPLSPELMRRSQFVGFALLLILMFFATAQDFSRLFG
ncbi:RIP metalloprotease RseP [Pectinatus sottacetonis]|uniref:RIP metalloprotease RseP n=1 Tax=Pectinatus sottacetonis TaxID=1002795 RepID=UPI001E476518|nr:RIP metalloprotease RseP [Pectinatus sottacetonis]